VSAVSEATIRVRVDPTNPGQFFACCGLLELADRLWGGAEGWFDEKGHFLLRPWRITPDFSASVLIDGIVRCPLTNTMTGWELQRRGDLSSMPKKTREAVPSLEDEKKALDALWRESPVLLDEPFHLRVDWFVDERSGGETLKTWAGQQSVVDIARGMKVLVEAGDFGATPSDDWLSKRSTSASLPFNFDAELGGMGSDRDVGFSFDPLKSINVRTRPLIELLAFVGLQRFRPIRITTGNRYRFSLWFDPLLPEVAATAACGLLESPHARAFEFRLLYRTKYLKSFLPATPITGSHR
jgi:CRISPR-associated protein Csb3